MRIYTYIIWNKMVCWICVLLFNITQIYSHAPIFIIYFVQVLIYGICTHCLLFICLCSCFYIGLHNIYWKYTQLIHTYNKIEQNEILEMQTNNRYFANSEIKKWNHNVYASKWKIKSLFIITDADLQIS